MSISAQPECEWRATSQVTWISRVAPATGQGPGQVSFDVAANSGASRTGSLVIGDQTLTVTQDGVCTYSVQPVAHTVPAAGGGRSSTVSAGQGCSWTAASQASWISITSGTSGSGAGTVGFNIAANVGPDRSGTLIVAGRTVTVAQSTGCVFTIEPLESSFGQIGGTRPVAVTALTGCRWEAATDSPSWITILAGGSGDGNGTVVYRVSPILVGTRTGKVIIAGQTHTVTQTR